MRLGLRKAVERGFIRLETSRSHRIEMDDSRSPDQVSAQAGRSFPGPGSGYGLEHERDGGLISVSGRMVAWHGERGLRASGPRAVFGFGPLHGLAHGVSSARAGRGPFSIFGPNFVVNSNLSQFIFCSEIV
jgi:hypothetical protein